MSLRMTPIAIATREAIYAQPRTVKLLEFNRVPHHPRLTVALANEEIAIQAAHEQEIFRMEGV